DAGTLQTEISSTHSNDDSQSSRISFDDAIIEGIISQIPDTPNTRKSVTFFEPVKNDNPPTFQASNALRPIYERETYSPPSEDGTFPGFESKPFDPPPKPHTVRGRSSTSIGMEEGGNSDDLLIPGRMNSITHRPSIIEEIAYIRSHYMKVWLIALLSAISLFVGGLMLLPSSLAPPLFPLIESSLYPLKLNHPPTLHVNRTSREIYISQHVAHDTFWSARYSQSFVSLGNTTFPMEFSHNRKCNIVVDENILCCAQLHGPVCHNLQNRSISYNITEGSVVDAEVYKGKMHILKYNRAKDEFVVDNGVMERIIYVPVGEAYVYKFAFLQNGTLFSYFEDNTNCEMQLLCMETECGEIRQPSCGIERIFPAVAGNSMVLMHCQRESENIDGQFYRTSCTLSQLLLPSLATISRSVPFDHVRSRLSDYMEAGFGDYIDTSVFHLNRLNQKFGIWEVEISTYRLLSIS
ncbi:hypothetical protein PFISCL1PPCAC_19370, partial [Pristionchus fissidentatus]